MLRTIIVDDEEDSIITLKWELKPYEDKIEILSSFQNPNLAIEEIIKQKPDLIFLDIQMPKMSGFELLKKVKGCYGNVVFITAFDQYAIRAFEVSAMDYLLKPIDSDLLSNTIEKISAHKNTQHLEQQLELILNNLNAEKRLEKVALPTLHGLDFVPISNIYYCQSDSNYTILFLKGDKKIIVSKTLREIERILSNSHFFRIHNSYIINLNYLDKYVRGSAAHVILDNGTEIPVSRSKKNDFLDKL